MKQINFYEVSKNGDVSWGGADPITAVKWFRDSIDNSLFVSIWDEEDPEEPKMVVDKIDISSVVLATILSERERG
ncbi:MAG: hypothetical protein ACO3QZ_06255 [Candidatus Nanopelagicaceae bacterium]